MPEKEQPQSAQFRNLVATIDHLVRRSHSLFVGRSEADQSLYAMRLSVRVVTQHATADPFFRPHGKRSMRPTNKFISYSRKLPKRRVLALLFCRHAVGCQEPRNALCLMFELDVFEALCTFL